MGRFCGDGGFFFLFGLELLIGVIDYEFFESGIRVSLFWVFGF